MEWLLQKWEKLLGYHPQVSRLEEGWHSFHLMNDGDVGVVLSQTWVLGQCFPALHRWDANFHLKKNAPVNHLVWAKLHGLPLIFWYYQAL